MTNKHDTAHFIGHTLIIVMAACVLLALVYHYFYGENGYYALKDIQHKLNSQIYTNQLQQQNNERLKADVLDLKTGLIATEEHARLDLGLIKKGEIFVRLSTAPIIHSDIASQNNEPDAVETVDGGPEFEP